MVFREVALASPRNLEMQISRSIEPETLGMDPAIYVLTPTPTMILMCAKVWEPLFLRLRN